MAFKPFCATIHQRLNCGLVWRTIFFILFTFPHKYRDQTTDNRYTWALSLNQDSRLHVKRRQITVKKDALHQTKLMEQENVQSETARLKKAYNISCNTKQGTELGEIQHN
jgi:hypothetical protein